MFSPAYITWGILYSLSDHILILSLPDLVDTYNKQVVLPVPTVICKQRHLASGVETPSHFDSLVE